MSFRMTAEGNCTNVHCQSPGVKNEYCHRPARQTTDRATQTSTPPQSHIRRPGPPLRRAAETTRSRAALPATPTFSAGWLSCCLCRCRPVYRVTGSGLPLGYHHSQCRDDTNISLAGQIDDRVGCNTPPPSVAFAASPRRAPRLWRRSWSVSSEEEALRLQSLQSSSRPALFHLRRLPTTER